MLALSLVGMGGCRSGDSAAKLAATKATQPVATQVSVVTAKIGPIRQIAQVTGSLNSLNDVTVGVKIAGKVRDVFVREGDTVRAGQVVAQQDPADLQAQYDQQTANLAAAQTKLDQSKVALQNARTTLQLTDAQTKSAVRQAQAALDIAKQEAQVVKLGARTQEREQAQENIASAKADRDKARADLKRYQELYKQNAVAAQQLDQAQAAADSADARYNSAMQAYSLIQEGARPEDIRRAQAAVEQANQAVVTAQANRDQVAMRRDDVETARAGIAAAQAGVEQAQAAVRLARQGINDAVIRSPIDGVVAERKVEPGMQLGAGKDVMRIVSLTDVYFDAQLPEVAFAQVIPGMIVDVTIDALGGRHFQGVVSKIYPVASTQARSFTVRIKLANERSLLRPQMFARGQIVLATHPRAVLVPRDAILDATETTGRVFVVVNDGKGKKAKEVKVTLGFSDPQQFEITSGVHAGDQVVTVGQSQLQDGTPVQIVSVSASDTAQTQ
jgi:RND family efflux transporter MFP subunit